MQAPTTAGGQPLVGLHQGLISQDRPPPQLQPAGILAGQIEQIAHQAAHALGLLLNEPQGRGAGLQARLAQQALGVARDQGDRRTQLMGHPIYKRPLPLPGNREALLQVVKSKGDGLEFFGLLGHGDLVGGQRRRLGGGELGGEFL